MIYLDVCVKEKYYSGIEFPILQNCHFSVEKNEFVSIVGPSGVGKSTLLRLISGLDPMFSGGIEIDGVSVRKPPSNMSVCFQEPRLMPWMTVAKNVQYGLDDNAIDKPVKVSKWLSIVQLESSSELYPGQLSGGMAQRASIARAFIREPDILLLDEPFSALDHFTRTSLQSELSQILVNSPTTVLLVTHDLEEAVVLSDRIIVMGHQPGRVIANILPKSPKPRSRRGESERQDVFEILKVLAN